MTHPLLPGLSAQQLVQLVALNTWKGQRPAPTPASWSELYHWQVWTRGLAWA